MKNAWQIFVGSVEISLFAPGYEINKTEFKITLRSFWLQGSLENHEFSSPVQIAQARSRWRGLARHLDRRFVVPRVRACRVALFSSEVEAAVKEKV